MYYASVLVMRAAMYVPRMGQHCGLCELNLLENFHFYTDVNECEEMTDNCHPDRAYCLNKDGSYQCKCKVGYILSDEEECIGNVADSFGRFIIQH